MGRIQERYQKELKQNKEAVEKLKAKIKEGGITLVYAAKDEEHNNAKVLLEILTRDMH